MDMPTRLPPAMRTGTSSSGMRCVSLRVSRVRVGPPGVLTSSPAKTAAAGDAGQPRSAVTTSRCSRIVSDPSRPGWRPKPQYIATPKSSRYFDAVACRRRRPASPSIGRTMPR